MIKNTFYFMFNTLFVLKVIYILTWRFGYVEKRFDEKAKFYFKSPDVTDWITNNCNTYIAQYLKKWRKPDNKIWWVNRIKNVMRNPLEKSSIKFGGETIPRSFYNKSKLCVFLDQQCEMLWSLFLLHVRVEVYQNILKLRWPLAFTLKPF